MQGLHPKRWPAPYTPTALRVALPARHHSCNLQQSQDKGMNPHAMQPSTDPATGHLALPVRHQAWLLQPVLLVPAQGFEAATQGHQAAVDGHALPAHSFRGLPVSRQRVMRLA